MSESRKTDVLRGRWLPFVLGGLPHQSPSAAWEQVLQHFPQLPTWPRLPQKSYLENMYTQFSERFPGLVLENGSIRVQRTEGLDRDLERLYLAYLEDDIDHGHISAAYAAGLDILRRDGLTSPKEMLALKGDITGPVSWGLTVVDERRRPILYDKVLEDAVGKHLHMKAAWQEALLRQHADQTLTIINEPYMASFGSAFVSLSRSQVTALFEQVLSGLKGLKGMHCCGKTDWSLVLNTSIDLLSIDAYDYVETLYEHAEAVTEFLKRGGLIGWGIVPAGQTAEEETVEHMVELLEQALEKLVERGVPRAWLCEASLISPSCHLGALSTGLAERIMALTVKVAQEMAARYASEGDKEIPASE